MQTKRMWIAGTLLLLASCYPPGANPSTITFQAAGGTYNTGTGSLGTVMIFRVTRAGGDSITGVNLTVNGPSGWNGNRPLSFSNASFRSGRPEFYVNATLPPVSGTYSITATIEGQTFSERFTVDANQSLAQPGGLRVSVSNVQIDASWEAAAGAASYLATVRNAEGRSFADALTTQTSAALSRSAALASGTSYDLFVYAFSTNVTGNEPALSRQVNASRQVVRFTP